MADASIVFESDCLRVGQPRPCAEDPLLMQLSGLIANTTLGAVEQRLAEAGWRTLRMGDPETLVGRLPSREMIIIDAGLAFDLSRVASVEVGTQMLRRLFDPSYTSQEEAGP